MVSAVGDNFQDQFPQKWPQFVPPQPHLTYPFGVSQADFAALKKEVEELKKVLQAAAAFDKATGQPECEMDEKVNLIKAVAKMVGVDLGEVFGPEKKSTP